MYAESMRLSERWAAEFREFWDLPADFDFPVPTPEVDIVQGDARAGEPGGLSHEGRQADAGGPRRRAPRPAPVKAIQSGYKDPARFDTYVELLQARAPWDDPIVLPFGEHLYIVSKGGGRYVVKCSTAGTSSASTRRTGSSKP